MDCFKTPGVCNPLHVDHVYIYIYVFIYVYIYMYIYIWVYLYIYIYIICIYIYNMYLYIYIYYVHVRNNPIFVSGDTQPSSAILFPKNTACQVTQGAAFVNIGGFPKNEGTPKWMVLYRKILLNWWFGVPLFYEIFAAKSTKKTFVSRAMD